MADLISSEDYSTIAENLASALESIETTKDFIYDNVYQIVILDDETDIIPTYDLHNVFFDDYQKTILLSQTNSPFLDGVRVLQRHVLRRGGFSNINDYLDDQDPQLTVPAKFAQLSNLAGFPITNLATDNNPSRTRIV